MKPTHSSLSPPRLSLRAEPLDRLLDGLALFGLVVLLALPALNYNRIPETVPIHFNFSGQPDSYGSKNALWVLPALGAVIFAGMFYLGRRPHLYNYPVTITTENAPRQYRIGSRLMRGVLAWVMWLFAFIVWDSIQIALGAKGWMGNLFLVAVLAGNALIIIGYWRAAVRKKPDISR